MGLSPLQSDLSPMTFHQSPADDLVFSFQHNSDCFRVGDVFLLKNTRRQRAFVVRIEHWNSFLYDDRAVIEFLIDKVHSASGHLHAIGKGLLLRFKSWE